MSKRINHFYSLTINDSIEVDNQQTSQRIISVIQQLHKMIYTIQANSSPHVFNQMIICAKISTVEFHYLEHRYLEFLNQWNFFFKKSGISCSLFNQNKSRYLKLRYLKLWINQIMFQAPEKKLNENSVCYMLKSVHTKIHTFRVPVYHIFFCILQIQMLQHVLQIIIHGIQLTPINITITVQVS